MSTDFFYLHKKNVFSCSLVWCLTSHTNDGYLHVVLGHRVHSVAWISLAYGYVDGFQFTGRATAEQEVITSIPGI